MLMTIAIINSFFVDEAGFNLGILAATGQVPGQHGAEITICAAISEDGVYGNV